MTADRADPEEVAELYGEAAELPAGERLVLLDRACAGRPALRAEVESLLAAHGAAGGFLEPAGEAPPVSRQGPYELLAELGHGGMGTVYLARRADQQFERRVAFKVVRRGLDTELLLQRFRRERQILAALDHPGIARLYDGGTTTEGLPYFVMEHVAGETLLAYCEHRALDTPARLRLFLAVCAAVAYAHRHLVVHRDLKPSNILVTADGEPKLLDFGLAKVLSGDGADETATLTALGLQPMTPEYASPEQVRAEAVTTATDVYSLGVILYELLTGRRPYALESRSPREIERVVCEAEPKKPSATDTERSRRALRGDLDTIVLKALAKEPERRYASVTELADDIRRYLDGFPVAARPDRFAYRAGKFVHRHRLGAAAAAVVTLSLLGGLLGTTWQARVAARERDVAARERDTARREAERAQAVQGFLVGLFKGSDPHQGGGKDVTAGELLRRGVERIGNDLSTQPEVQVDLLDTVVDILTTLGDNARARELAEQSLAIARRTHGPHHLRVAQAQFGLAEAFRAEGNYEEAERLHRVANSGLARLLSRDDPRLARSMTRLAMTLRFRSKLEEAEPPFRRALAIQRRRLGNAHAETAKTMVELGALLQSKADYAGAEALHREALSSHRAGGRSTQVAVTLGHLGNLRWLAGDYAGAAGYHREALELNRQLFGEDHTAVGASTHNVAAALQGQGKLREAEPLYRRALEIDRGILGAEHPKVGVVLNNLASVLAEQGKFAEAMPLFAQSIAVQRQALGEDHPQVALFVTKQARALLAQGRVAEAAPLVERALAVAVKHHGEGHPQVATTLALLARTRAKSGAAQEAVALYQRALAIQDRILPPGHPNTIATRTGLAEARLALARAKVAGPRRP